MSAEVEALKLEPMQVVNVGANAEPEQQHVLQNGNGQTNSESFPADLPLDEILPMRSQKLQLPDNIREQKPAPKDVIVLAFGSFGIRYGFAADSSPKTVFPGVALPRQKDSVVDKSRKAFLVPSHTERTNGEIEEARKVFDDTRESISFELALSERRRGGGRPIPWKAVVEATSPETTQMERRTLPEGDDTILIGHDVQLLLRDEKRANQYDIILPIWDGKLLFECGAPASLIRYSLDLLLDYVTQQMARDRKLGKRKDRKKRKEGGHVMQDENPEEDHLFAKDGRAKIFVTLVMPETAQRRDVSEIVDAVYRSKSMQAAAIFIHQSAVSCALGAGLATCTVVDIGHSATTVACVDDGVVCGESRIHLEYGSLHVQQTFDLLLRDYSNLNEMISTEQDGSQKPRPRGQIEEDLTYIVARATEQLGGFNVDENDTLSVAKIGTPSGYSLRLKIGVGIRTMPCYGLIYPKLLKAANEYMVPKKNIPRRGLFERNSEDDNFVSDIFNDLRRSGIATAAQPIGTFANDRGQPAATSVDPNEASLVDAIIWSVAKAVEIKRPHQQSRTADHYKKYLNAIVLAGGGALIDGIALALESRIKKGFLDAGVAISDVTVIDGGKGKGDEELAAAAAVLKDVDSDGGIIDDTDTASLPWKGGAVLVEADAVNEYWIYRDDWEVRNVRALRERAPFYW